MKKARIRKSVVDLSQADLIEHPVWEFALDEEGAKGQDETTVRPWRQPGALDPSEGMFVVRARFTLADGTAMPGYITPPAHGDDGLGTLQPVITADSGHIVFWCGRMAPNSDDVQRNYLYLWMASASDVFPISFESVVPIVGGAIKGELAGFLVLEDIATGRIRTIT